MDVKCRSSCLVAVWRAAVPSCGKGGKGKPAWKRVKADRGTPPPAAEMAQLKFFDGNWTCAGTMSASPFGPAGKMTSTVRTHSDLGGFWESGVVKGTSPGMPPFEGMFHMTWDPGAKHHVMFWVDNTGGWAQSTAPGGEGATIVFSRDSYMGARSSRPPPTSPST